MSKHSVNFSGIAIETTVTKDVSVAMEWVNEIRSIYNGGRIIVGLDCEWRCTDYWGWHNKVATLQLCVKDKCLILQLYYMDYIPPPLKSFLNDPNVTCVGVEVDEDVSRLRNEYGFGRPCTADVRELAWRSGRRWDSKPGLKTLACSIIGVDMEKPIHVCKSDWQASTLSEEQIRYGCIDAYVSYKIGHTLLVDEKIS